MSTNKDQEFAYNATILQNLQNNYCSHICTTIKVLHAKMTYMGSPQFLSFIATVAYLKIYYSIYNLF
jgi:hypothetical protein